MNRIITISGKVQGVFFRLDIKKMADQLGLHGWVKNTDEGKVQAQFIGEKSKVEQIINYCKQGPPLANVTNLEIEESEQEYSDQFDILF